MEMDVRIPFLNFPLSVKIKQVVALKERNRTGPTCSVTVQL